MALGSGLLQLFAGGPRECFSENKSTSVDITAICHEVRGIELSEDEKVFVTFKDMRKHAGEQLVPLGFACHMRSVEFDASLLLRVWAARDEESARSRSEGARIRRNCGELRIPLHRVAAVCDGMLYQTWVTLDCPGLCDSVASIGLGDESNSFEQKLVDGPRQLFQPRVFLSIGKTADLGPTGELLLSADATPEARNAHWGPLLRSQQQHAVMSAALHLQGAQAAPRQGGEQPASAEQSARAAARIQDARGRVQAQTESLEALRLQLRDAEEQLEAARNATRRCAGPGSSLEAPGPGDRSPWTPPNWDRPRPETSPEDLGGVKADPLGRTLATEAEVERLKAVNSAEQARIEALRAELEGVRQQANNDVDAANDRIRSFRRDRDESIRECKRLEAEAEQVVGQREELAKENRQMAEKVQALKRLVEELYETINGAGLQASRKSVDSINAIFKVS
mmetsp:Transcript_27193/g.54954  ORF Transcript_27193/g.54954 Transcript_27193/m.54954 type:complete len:454 (-) Transcript_27193:67-1428(-)